jgi:hypothetical protein
MSSSLVFIKNNRNKFCGKWSVKGRINDQTHFVKLGCKRWACPDCGPKRARLLKNAIITKATEKGLNRFITLTLNPKACSAEESAPYIRECWRKFRTYLKREYGVTVSFISVVELHKSGYAHLHILVNRYISHNWLKSNWESVGGGQMVWIKYVDCHRIAGYLAKYLTKELILAQFKPNQRRYSTSRDIVLFVKQPKGNWVLLRVSLDYIYSTLKPRIKSEKWDLNNKLVNFQISEN